MDGERQEWLTTGQAARFCSVKPDTILKWIKRGRLCADRTAGGHYRIQRAELEPLMLRPRTGIESRAGPRFSPHPLRCWEYLGNAGSAPDECRQCVVYQTRAAWCFQMVEMSRGQGHAKRFCRDSCADCAYYKRVKGLATHVLVVSDEPDLSARLDTEIRTDIEIRVARDGYEASALIHEFRPAFVLVDHDLTRSGSGSLLDRLAGDPRIPGARIILAVGAGKTGRVRGAIQREYVVGIVEKPLGVDQIASVLDAFPVETHGPTEGRA